MMISLFDVFRASFLFFIGGIVLVEIVGYLWHRLAEHEGWFGEVIRYRHRVHHESHYPIESLRPKNFSGYKDARSWSWYILAIVTIGPVLVVVPLRDAMPLSIGGALYAYFVVNYFHAAFHIDDHWLNRFRWFRRLVTLHDIHHWVSGNYGIIFFGMDRLFGTLRTTMPSQKEDIFPNRKGLAHR